MASHAETNLSWDSGEMGYDGSGNIKAMGANAYVYTAGRIVQATVNGVTESYGYDWSQRRLERHQ
jgi:hypothetical protein